MTARGIAESAGVGRWVSELMTYGESPNYCPYHYDVRRLPPGSNNKRFCRSKAQSTLANVYRLMYPGYTYSLVRNVLKSPLHELLNNNGAVWEQSSSWEIPVYFNQNKQSKIMILKFCFENSSDFYSLCLH